MRNTIKSIFCALLMALCIVSCSDDDSNSVEENGVTENNGSTGDDTTGGDDTSGDNDDTTNETSIADEIFRLVNEHRASKGLPAFSKNETAEKLAADHTNYMIEQNRISHDDFNSRFQELSRKENARTAAENVAAGQRSAASVMESWLNSKEGHKENIEGNFTHIGISAIKNSQGKYFYTQLFYR